MNGFGGRRERKERKEAESKSSVLFISNIFFQL